MSPASRCDGDAVSFCAAWRPCLWGCRWHSHTQVVARVVALYSAEAMVITSTSAKRCFLCLHSQSLHHAKVWRGACQCPLNCQLPPSHAKFVYQPSPARDQRGDEIDGA